MSVPKIPGIKCPDCKNIIPVAIEQIKFQKYIICPICGYTLKIDNDK